jgi:YesN/AraC family two-component response regulator
MNNETYQRQIEKVLEYIEHHFDSDLSLQILRSKVSNQMKFLPRMSIKSCELFEFYL